MRENRQRSDNQTFDFLRRYPMLGPSWKVPGNRGFDGGLETAQAAVVSETCCLEASTHRKNQTEGLEHCFLRGKQHQSSPVPASPSFFAPSALRGRADLLEDYVTDLAVKVLDIHSYTGDFR